MKIKWLIFFVLVISPFFNSIIAQNQKEDSLINRLDGASPTEVYEIYTQLFEEVRRTDFEKALEYAQKANHQAKKIKNNENIGSSYNRIGAAYDFQGKYALAKAYYDSALNVCEEIEYTIGVALAHTNLGVINRKIGDTDKALDHLLKSLRIREQLKDTAGVALSLHNIGSIYYTIDEYEKAIEYFLQALEYNTMMNKPLEIAKNNNNIGSVYIQINKLDEALKHYEAALDYFKTTKYKIYVAIIQDNIGSIYEKKGEYDRALSYHNSTMQIHEKLNNNESLVYTYNNIGNLYMKMGQFSKADSYLNKSFELAKKSNNIEQLYEINHSLAESNELQGKYKSALKYYKEHAILKDSLMSENTRNQIAELETKYETEKKENQIQLQKIELERQEAELRQHTVEKYAFITGLLLISAIVVILAISYREKRKSNKILAEKNRNITESITYARKIQSAILPPEDLINNMLPEHFILFKPRDIVSGDFYWITRANKKTIVAAADCTGHGVPGAFMSVLGFTLLNEVVSDLDELKPNLILNNLRNKVKNALRQEGKDYETQDGIDIAMCIIDQEKLTLEYAGAHNPMIIIKNGELQKIKADMMPVGYQIKEKDSFTNHKLSFSSGDMLYLYSDGYLDQFGGDRGSRFKAGKFEKLLVNIYTKPIDQQKEYLEKTLQDWKGGYDQIDDILVMGIRLG